MLYVYNFNGDCRVIFACSCSRLHSCCSEWEGWPFKRKERDPTPTPTENANVTTQKRHQNFDYTTIADRLRTVSWGNDSHPTGVVIPVSGILTLPTYRKSRVIKRTHILTFVNNPPYGCVIELFCGRCLCCHFALLTFLLV